MKQILAVLLVAFLASPLSAQTIRKAWQVQFDFGAGGNQDDAQDLLIDSEGNYIVTGNTILVTTSGLAIKAAATRVTKSGDVLWKWVSANDTSWTGPTTAATCLQGTNFFVAQGSQRNLAKLLTFSLDGEVIHSRTFGEEKNLAITTNGTMGAAIGYGNPVNVYFFDAAGDSIRSFVASGYVAGFHATLTQQRLGLFGNDYTSHGNWNTAAFAKVFDLQGNVILDKHYDDAVKATGTIDGGDAYLGYTSLTKAGNNQDYGQAFTVVKYDVAQGLTRWINTWDGDPTPGTYLVSWTEDLISYPGGGCILLGSIAKNGNAPNANLTDFGAIAYDGDGNVRWKLRFEAHAGWERNDLKTAAWDKDGYLILVGSTFKKWDEAPDDHRYLVLSKWFVDGVTAVEQISSEIPNNFALRQNYPNPFNPRTTIEFELPERSAVRITVLNLLGQELETLVDEDLPAGVHRTEWDGKNLPSGIYFYRLEAKNFAQTKKMILLK